MWSILKHDEESEDMDAFQRYQQDQAKLLQQANAENAAAAQTEADRVSAEREAERKANEVKNLGKA